MSQCQMSLGISDIDISYDMLIIEPNHFAKLNIIIKIIITYTIGKVDLIPGL